MRNCLCEKEREEHKVAMRSMHTVESGVQIVSGSENVYRELLGFLLRVLVQRADHQDMYITR